MFINYKIFDEEFHYLGATGIALKTSYVNDMLRFFRKKYHFNVYFVNKKGEVVLSEIEINKLKQLDEIKELNALKDDTSDSILSRVDDALYEAKNSGKNQLVIKY